MTRSCRSVLGSTVRVKPEAVFHCQFRHPELKRVRDLERLIVSVIEEPDIVVKGGHGEYIAMKHVPSISLSAKYLVVPYEEEGEVKTAFAASRPERILRREIIWKRS